MANMPERLAPVARRSVSSRNSLENTRYARALAATVAAAFGIEERQLFGRTRGAPQVARARQVAMYMAHVAVPMTLTDVGRAFGRDRTTAAHACRVVEMARDHKPFDQWLNEIERRFHERRFGAGMTQERSARAAQAEPCTGRQANR